MKSRLICYSGVTLFALSMSVLHACPFCFASNGGSRIGDAVTWGIVAMVIIMFSMLGCLYGFMRYLIWREKNPLPDYSDLLKSDKELEEESI